MVLAHPSIIPATICKFGQNLEILICDTFCASSMHINMCRRIIQVKELKQNLNFDLERSTNPKNLHF